MTRAWERFVKVVGMVLVVIFLSVLALQVAGVLDSGPHQGNEGNCAPVGLTDTDC